MKIKITEPYIWLPVDNRREEKKLHFYIDGKKIEEIDIRLGGTDCDFYACCDVSPYLNKTLEIVGHGAEHMLDGIFCWHQKPQHVYPFRPQLHFAPEVGWHNDPNGLIYANGVYHLYYQWNPYGVGWGNMHWGHGVSRDMIRWEHCPAVLKPDETGTAYSGCAIQDKKNLAGFGKDALLYYYTAAGGRNEWSRSAGNLFTQRLAYSLDNGQTLTTSDKFKMEHIVNENRDPKVFYHEPTNAYIQVLYLDENEFALYRSEDLLEWKETQRLDFHGMWECPDLFELKVINEDNEKKWVFWSADGYYVIGDFDGYTFKAESSVQNAYSSKLPYAAQSFSGIEGRVVNTAWLRLKNVRGHYCGLMSIPTELALKKTDKSYRMCFRPVRELESYRGKENSLETDPEVIQLNLQGRPVQIDFSWDAPEEGRTKAVIQNIEMTADFNSGCLRFQDRNTGEEISYITLRKGEKTTLSLIIDQEVIEFFGNDGTIYGMAETEENVLKEKLCITMDAHKTSVTWYEFNI